LLWNTKERKPKRKDETAKQDESIQLVKSFFVQEQLVKSQATGKDEPCV
jgi:hypothetical protein